MANGKPGDHPYTDVMVHGGSEYGEPVDGLVRELAALQGFDAVRDEVADLLLELSPAYRADERAALTREAQQRLEAIRTRLGSGI